MDEDRGQKVPPLLPRYFIFYKAPLGKTLKEFIFLTPFLCSTKIKHHKTFSSSPWLNNLWVPRLREGSAMVKRRPAPPQLPFTFCLSTSEVLNPPPTRYTSDATQLSTSTSPTPAKASAIFVPWTKFRVTQMA